MTRDALIKAAEAAERLGVSHNTIIRGIHAKQITGVLFPGRRWYVPEAEVVELLERGGWSVVQGQRITDLVVVERRESKWMWVPVAGGEGDRALGWIEAVALVRKLEAKSGVAHRARALGPAKEGAMFGGVR